MKKSIKVLGLSLALAPLVMLTACGGEQLGSKPNLDVNNAGSYSTATAEDFNQVAYDETTHDVKSDFAAYKIGLTMKGQDSKSGNGEVSFVGIFKVTEEKTEYAYSSYVNAEGVNAKIKYYVPGDGYCYADANIKGSIEGFDTSMDGKYKIDAKDVYGMFDEVSAAELANGYSYANILSMVEGFKGEGITIEKAERESKVNYKFTVAATEYSPELAIYFFYEDGKIVACQYEASAADASLKITIEAFDGEIEYPDFSSYKAFLPSLG